MDPKRLELLLMRVRSGDVEVSATSRRVVRTAETAAASEARAS